MISKDKKYKTKYHGYEVHILETVNGWALGYYIIEREVYFQKWDDEDGEHPKDNLYDLVEVKPEYIVISNGIGNSIHLDGKRIDPQQLPEGKYKLIPIEDDN